MFSRGMRLFMACSYGPLSVSRTYRKVKVKTHERKPKNGAVVKGNPGGNRTLAMILEGKSPEESNVTLEDIEDGENDMIDSHLFYNDHMEEIKKQKNTNLFITLKESILKVIRHNQIF